MIVLIVKSQYSWKWMNKHVLLINDGASKCSGIGESFILKLVQSDNVLSCYLNTASVQNCSFHGSFHYNPKLELVVYFTNNICQHKTSACLIFGTQLGNWL